MAVLQNAGAANSLWGQCGGNPVVAFRGRKLTTAWSSAKGTAGLIKTHHAHLLWHISRLYRIRCCIVHGAPIRFRLALLAANLEFYLKELILFVIDSFRRHQHVTALDAIYGRAELGYASVVGALEATAAGTDAVTGAVFNSLVIQEAAPAPVPAAALPAGPAAAAATAPAAPAAPAGAPAPATAPAAPVPGATKPKP